MEYIITDKKNKKRFDNVVLENSTEAESRIEWKGNKYLVKEIIIVNPEEGIIELKCWNVNNTGKKAELESYWS